MRAVGLPAALAQLAQSQRGYLSRSQLLSEVSPRTVSRWVANGRLERVAYGVYRIAGSPAPADSHLRIALLGARAFAAASHRAAASLHRLDGVRRQSDVVCHTPNRTRLAGLIVHESTDLRDGDITEVRGIPCTTVVRTLLDLGAVVRPEVVEQALDDALRRRLCTLDQVALRHQEIARRGRSGVGVLRPFLEERLGSELSPATGFEQRMIRLIRAAGLPEPVRQHRVQLPGGGHAFLDLAWPDISLAVECDDLASHFAAHRLRWDEQRQNELVLLGWTVLRFTFHDVRDLPERTMQAIREGHRRAGRTAA